MPHGAKDATASESTIRRWWKSCPAANVAIATGPQSFVALDVDPDKGGDESLADLTAQYDFLPETPQALTGGDGRHLLFAHPGVPVPNAINLVPGLDLRGDGGYIVAPPSVHVSGKLYAWEASSHPDDVDLAPMPTWLLELATSRRDGHRGSWPLDTAAVLAGVPEGQRDETLFKLACRLRRADVPRVWAERLFLEAAANCDPPFSEKDALAKVSSAYDRYAPAGDEEVSSVNSVSSPGVFSPAKLPPVPPFPVTVLPGPARKLVEEGAAALGAPPELIAVPLLVGAGAAIGNQHRIQLKPGFEQRSILYAGVVAPPGFVKSPALDLARYPLERLQEEAKVRFDADLERHNHSVQAANAWNPHGPKPERPKMEHFFSTDATTEAMAMMLTSSPGFALVRDELVGWVRSFDAYRSGRGGDRQNWLSLWSGTTLKVDRKTADPILVTNPVVCVCGGAQPDMLRELADEAGRRDGFIERILWSYPDVEPVGWTEDTVQEETKDAVVEVFRQLRHSDSDGPVHLSPEAKAIWVVWYDDNALRAHEARGLLAGVYAKLPNQAARLALILHCLEHPGDPQSQPVDAETMKGALDLTEYFRRHACRAMVHFGVAAIAPSGGLAARCLNILVEVGGEWLDLTRLHAGLGGHVASEELARALSDLEAMGLAEHHTLPSGPAGGRPREQWRAEPPSEETEETAGGQG